MSHGTLKQVAEMRVLRSAFLASHDLGHVVANGEHPLPMKLQAPRTAAERQQRNPVLLAVNVVWKSHVDYAE